MKKLDLAATDENILSTLQEDIFRRNEKIGYFLKLLNFIEGSFTIALDGQWGSGKTFFIKQSQLVMEAYNPNIDMDDSKRTIVKRKMSPFLDKGNCNRSIPFIMMPGPMIMMRIPLYHCYITSQNHIVILLNERLKVRAV